MKLAQVIEFLDNLVLTKIDRHLKEVEIVVLTGAWEAKTYEQIAKTSQYSLSYIKQAAAPRLWKLFSEILEKNISKTNFRAVIEELQQSRAIDTDDLFSSSHSQISEDTQSHRLLRHVRHKRLGKPQATRTCKTTEPSYEVCTGGINAWETTGDTPFSTGGTPATQLRAAVTVGKDDRIVCDWNQAPENSFFYGRTSELEILRKWLIEERCRLIAVVGMGGIGKTALSLRCAKNLQHEFEFVIWRQLTNPGGLRKILIELIQMTGDRQDNLADEFNSQIDALLTNLRQHRCLIVLDTSPAMFPSGNSAKNYQQEYQDYEQLLKRLGQEQHKSCLMLIAREKPREIALIEGETLPTRTLHLKGLGSEAKDIFRAKGLLDVEKWSDLVEVYRGNPLALKIVANTIKGLFGGKVATFLKQKTIIFGELNDLLDEQFESISTLEEQILYWLVINRQPISLSKLRSQMVIPVATAKLIEALESLLRNSFIERNIVADEVKFSLEQPVVIQYVINCISDRLSQEILTVGKNQKVEQLSVLRTLNLRPDLDNPIEQPEYFLVRLILDRLGETLQDENLIEQQLTKILSLLPENSFLAVGYAKNNLEILLADLKVYFEPKIKISR